MPRETYDQELQRLQDEVLALGGMVEKAIIDSVETFEKRDREAARLLIAGDRAINKRRFAIEADALTVIATQQPLASDLRTLAAVLVIATELERIADYAKGIAKVNILLDDQPLLEPFDRIPRMAEMARDMVHQSLEAFVQRDVALARAIPDRDDEMDALHNEIYRGLFPCVISDPQAIDRAMYLLWVAHNLERTADRVINICERVVYTVTGEMVEMDVGEGQDLGLEGLA